jgi:hypothetical protein
MEGNILEIIPHTKWFWLTIIEFGVIVILLNKFAKQRRINKINDFGFERKGVDNVEIVETVETVDMDNLMDNIYKSKSLFNELKKKCHPDRFVNQDCHSISEKLFQEVMENEKNYGKLKALKEKAVRDLNISI